MKKLIALFLTIGMTGVSCPAYAKPFKANPIKKKAIVCKIKKSKKPKKKKK